MAIIHPSFLFLTFLVSLLFLLFSGSKEKVEAYRFEEMMASHQLRTHVVSLSSLMPSDVCSSSANDSEASSKPRIQVTQKYGACSPLNGGKSKIPSLHQILINDQTRVKSIHSRISNQQSSVADSTVKLPANTGDSGNFVVRIGLGTPEQKFTLAFDTGSDLTWTQCQPCATYCYHQQDPYFNSSASSTYSTVQCGSDTCSQLTSGGYEQALCTTNCLYKVRYGDDSYSQGDFVTDTLTLSSSETIPNFEFGCGQNNDGLFGTSDGLLGLGRDQISLVSQTAQQYGKIFSYCLPSTSSSTGFLAFGSEAGSSSSDAQYTPLQTNADHPSFYFLTMTGISVNGQKLSIAESVFTTSGTIIDSGTVITRLAPDAYSALSSAFRQAMSKYPIAPAYEQFDTCYDLSGYSSVELPSIVLQFSGGAELNVHPSGILIEESSTQHCLAFLSNNDVTDMQILGNQQQHTFEVVYNVAGEKLGFGSGACS